MNGELKIFSGSSNKPLAEKISKHLELNLGEVHLGKFADGEIDLQYIDNVRGNDVFIIQSTNPPGDNLIELLLMIDAAKRSSAKRITAVIPYFGYARQERKDKPRKAISAKLMADLITTAGANRVLALELHSDAIQGFFDIPFDHLYFSYTAVPYLKNLITDKNKTAIVSPDVGGLKKARAYSSRLNVVLAVIDKQRKAANQIKEMTLIGNVKGKDVILIDDIIDTAGTLCEASCLLSEKKVKSIIVIATHALLSKNAVKNLIDSKISKIFISDTIYKKATASNLEYLGSKKFEVMSSAPLLAEAVKRIHEEKSVSELILD